MSSKASQQHGIDFENTIHLALHGTPKKEYEKLIEGGYTAEFDIVKGIKNINFNGSVKVTSSNNVECGSIERMYKHTNGDGAVSFTMIIGCHNQVGNDKVYNTIYEVDIKPEHHSLLWSDMQLNTLTEYVNYVKSIPKGKEAQLQNQKLWKEKRQTIYENEGQGIMKIDTKIDGKTQRRTQASFNIKTLEESGIPFRKYTQEYRGIDLPHIQKNSSPRERNKK